MVQIGWIGLGNMGQGMVKNLVLKGKLVQPLIIYNRTISKANDLARRLKEEHNVDVTVKSEYTAVVAESQIIYMILGKDEHVLEYAKNITETLGGPKPEDSQIRGKTFVDCSTIAPETTAEVARLFENHGAFFVAAPVFGAPAHAEKGELLCVFASHNRDAIDRLLPYADKVMGRGHIILEGKPPGTASLLKLSGNHFIISMVLTIAESMTLAEKSGLGQENVKKFLEGFFPGPYVLYANRMMSGDYDRGSGPLNEGDAPGPLFAVDLALKDARHLDKIATDAGVELGIVRRAIEMLSVVKEERGERGDLPGMYGAMRVRSGLSYTKEKTD